MITVLRRIFVDPIQSTPPNLDQRIRYIAAVVLSVAIFVIITNVTFWLTNYDFKSEDIIASFSAFILTLIAYILARMGNPTLASWIMLSVISASILLLAFSPSEQDDPLLALIFMIVPISLSASLLSNVAHTLYWVMMISIILISPLFLDWVDYNAAFSGPVIVVLAFGITSSTVQYIISQMLNQQYEKNADLKRRLDVLMTFESTAAILTQDGIIKEANYAAAQLFQKDKPETMHGQRIEEFINISEQSLISARRVQYQDSYGMRTKESIIVNGQPITVELINIPIIHQQKLASQILITPHNDHPSQTLKQLEAVMKNFFYELRGTKANTLTLYATYGAFKEMTGYSQPQAETLLIDQSLFLEDERSLVVHQFKQALKGENSTTDIRIATQNQQIIWIEHAVWPVYQDDEIVGVIARGRNITEQMQTENSLNQYNMQQAIVAELGQRALRQPDDLKGFVEEAMMLCKHLLDIEYAATYEYNDNVIKLFTQVGWFGSQPNARHNLLQKAVDTNDIIIIADSADATDFDASQYPYAIGSLIIIPLQRQNEPIGAIEFCSEQPRAHNPEDVHFLQSIANIIASFVEKRRVDTAEREQRAISQAIAEITTAITSTQGLVDILDKLLSNLSRIVPHDAASVMVIKGDVTQIISHRGFQPKNHNDIINSKFQLSTNTFLQKMIQSRQGVIIPDVTQAEGWQVIPGNEWIRGYMGVPVVFHDRIIGIINVDSAQTNAFTPANLEHLQTLASQASVAIRNAEYTEELEVRVEQRTQELQIERRSLQTILDNTGEGITYLEGQSIRYTNDILAQMTDYTIGELLGMNIQQLIQPTADEDEKHDFWEVVNDHTQQNKIWRSEAIVRCKNGKTFDAGLTISLIDSAKGYARTVILIRDISEAKLLEKQKARFIANASHELRTPITSLNTRLYLMQRAPEKLPEHLNILEQVIDRMNRLVEDLLDTSRFQNGVIQMRPRSIVLQNVLNKVIDLQKDNALTKQITINYFLESDPVQIYGDPDRLEQVFTNLINNAINYTKEGGTITIQGKIQPEDTCIVITIQDTGIGIEEEHLKNIFQPFYRGNTAVRGTGLGLSITKEIIEQHQGSITVDSTVNEGSTFTIKLPLS